MKCYACKERGPKNRFMDLAPGVYICSNNNLNCLTDEAMKRAFDVLSNPTRWEEWDALVALAFMWLEKEKEKYI
jgi:hypothetical protein